MKLTDLDPQFLKMEVVDGKRIYRHVGTPGEADGIRFLCPKCFEANKGSGGTHGVMCWKPGTDAISGPGRWPMLGTGYHDLTLTPSIQLLGGCGWHGFLINGETSTC